MAISVDKVYRKVLAILNKESRGFLTPDEFNRIGSQVQLDLLDKAFHDYNRAVSRETVGRGAQGYGDIPKKIQDRIDPFYTTNNITLVSGVGALPTVTVDDYTRSNVYNIVRVTTQDNSSLNITEVDRIEKSKLTYLLSSSITSPSTTFPIYYITGQNINVNPIALSSVSMDYISIPSDPVWNSTADSNGALTYTATGSTDFTLHSSSEVDLVLGILRYTGVIIKDPSVIQAIGQETATKVQQENA
tara:strand:+ start:8046 stop:8783 length:738 start_codon:yes stop_codon:yes gene_type:complete